MGRSAAAARTAPKAASKTKKVGDAAVASSGPPEDAAAVAMPGPPGDTAAVAMTVPTGDSIEVLDSQVSSTAPQVDPFVATGSGVNESAPAESTSAVADGESERAAAAMHGLRVALALPGAMAPGTSITPTGKPAVSGAPGDRNAKRVSIGLPAASRAPGDDNAKKTKKEKNQSNGENTQGAKTETYGL